jgi:hypothetical protein
MPIAVVATVLIQIACAIHVVRTGRPMYWIFIILVTSVLGCIVYFFVAILPDLTASRAARQATNSLVKQIDPERELRRLADQFETADTVENRRLLAEEWVRQERPDKAIELYEGAMTGVMRDEPILLTGLAGAQFAAERPNDAIATLDRLRDANPDYQSADAHLLYARALEAAGRDTEALSEYEALVRYFPGVEARCRMGLLLERLGRGAEAQVAFHQVVRSLDRAGRGFRQAQRDWYELARQRIAT